MSCMSYDGLVSLYIGKTFKGTFEIIQIFCCPKNVLIYKTIYDMQETHMCDVIDTCAFCVMCIWYI